MTLEKHCIICGEEINEFNSSRLVRSRNNSSDEFGKVEYICSSCDQLKTIREYDFQRYLRKIISDNKNYSHYTPIIGNIPVFDFTVRKGGEVLSIEVKGLSTLSDARIEQLITDINHYNNTGLFGFKNPVVAIPGRLPPEAKERFEKNNIQLWDLDFISSEFREEIEAIDHPILQKYFLNAPNDINEEEKLLIDLSKIEPGKKDWVKYQKIVGIILENLFCPPLSKPIPELTDYDKINRRDFIFPNYCYTGIWYHLRKTYKADFIVVDAKNFKTSISKTQVLQILNYLKYHGAGLFAIIVSRQELNNSCQLLLREKWILDKKMIVNLTDNDLKKMLYSKSIGEPPEELIKQKIEDFRLKI